MARQNKYAELVQGLVHDITGQIMRTLEPAIRDHVDQLVRDAFNESRKRSDAETSRQIGYAIRPGAESLDGTQPKRKKMPALVREILAATPNRARPIHTVALEASGQGGMLNSAKKAISRMIAAGDIIQDGDSIRLRDIAD